MRLLLDTHIFLWFISADDRLSKAVRDSLRNPENEVYLSVVSLWETIVKCQIGRLSLPQPPETYLTLQRERHQISSLPLDEASVSRLPQLPLIHRDPFDRMLICQAMEHGLTLLTVDDVVASYPVSISRV